MNKGRNIRSARVNELIWTVIKRARGFRLDDCVWIGICSKSFLLLRSVKEPREMKDTVRVARSNQTCPKK